MRNNSAGRDAGTGYVARDVPNNMIIVAFQGTSDGVISKERDFDDEGFISNQLEADLKIFRRISPNTCLAKWMPKTKNGCEVHEGFWNSWNQMETFVELSLSNLKSENPGYKFVFTGHSLGGAIAALGATHFRNMGWVVDLVSSFSSFSISTLLVPRR